MMSLILGYTTDILLPQYEVTVTSTELGKGFEEIRVMHEVLVEVDLGKEVEQVGEERCLTGIVHALDWLVDCGTNQVSGIPQVLELMIARAVEMSSLKERMGLTMREDLGLEEWTGDCDEG